MDRFTWTFEKCKKEALKHKTKKSFREKSYGCYQACSRKKWLNTICKNMTSSKRVPNGYWTLNNCRKEAKKYKNRGTFSKKSNVCYNICRKNNWLDSVSKHMTTKAESFSMTATKWTFEKCKKEALKYKTRKEFKKKAQGCYSRCSKSKYLNIVCKHMIKINTGLPSKWTFEKCKKEVLKYKTRAEFKRKSSGCFTACSRKKWLNSISKHMKKNSFYEYSEKEIAQPKVLCFLKKLELKVEKEFNLSSNSRVDFLCTNKNNRKISIEVKSDISKHSSKSIKTQISRYKTAGKKKFGNFYAGTFLVSPKGRYGYSLHELKTVLKQKGLI